MTESLVRRFGQYDAVLLTAGLWFLGKFVRFAFPPLFDQLSTVYGVSLAVLGGAFSALLLVYAALQFPVGLLADRLSPVTVIAVGSALAVGGAFALSLDGPFVVLVGAMVAVGAGTGPLKTVGLQILSRTYPAQTGRVFGVFDTVGTLGGAVAPAAVVLFAGSPAVFGAGWRTTFLLAGVAGIGVTTAFVVRVGDRMPDEADRSGDDAAVPIREYGTLFREWRFAVFVLVTSLFSFAFNAALAFLPLYFTRAAGLDQTTASLLFSTLFVVSFVQLLTGELSDRTGTLLVIAFTVGLAAVGLGSIVLLTGVAGPLAFGVAVVCFGLGAHGYRPVRGAYLMSVIPTSVAGGSLGAVRTIQMLAGASAPALVGVLSEATGLEPAFTLLTAALLLATVLSALLWLADGD